MKRRALTPFLGFVGVALMAAAQASALTLAAGDLVAVDSNQGQLVRVDPISGATSVIANVPQKSADVVVDRQGRIFVLDRGNTHPDGRILEVDPATGSSSVVTTGLLGANKIDVDADGFLITNDARGLVRTDPATGVQTAFALGGLDVSEPGFVAALPDGGAVAARIRSTSAPPDGNIEWLDFIQVDFATGATTTIQSRFWNGESSYVSRNTLGDVEADPATGRLYEIHRNRIFDSDNIILGPVDSGLASDAFFLESSISQPEEPWPLPMAIDASGDVLVACAALPTICLPPPGHEFSLMRFHPKAHGFDLSIVGLDIALREIAVVPVPEVGTGLLLAAGLTLMRSRKIAQPGGIKGT